MTDDVMERHSVLVLGKTWSVILGGRGGGVTDDVMERHSVLVLGKTWSIIQGRSYV